MSVCGGTKAPPYESKEITATVREAGDKIPFSRLRNPRSCEPTASTQERGVHRGERMLKFRKMRHVRFFLNETLFPLCGVSLVRFLPTRARNEHKNPPINSNLSTKKTTEHDLWFFL